MAVSQRMKKFADKSSWIRKMFEEGAKLKAAHGADNVFDFSLGNPDAPVPQQFNEVLAEVAADKSPTAHSYMPNGGYPWVRESLAYRINNEQKVSLTAGEVIMTCGAAGALNVIMKAILDPGDEVIVPIPYFVDYGFYIDNHGGVMKTVATKDDFNLDLDGIGALLNEKTKAILINSPNNPTGQIYSQQVLDKLAAMLQEASEKYGTSILIIADEPYRKIVFDNNEAPPILGTYRNSIVATSYSKDLSLPGERIGYIAVNPDIDEKKALMDALTMANRILGFINAPALMQRVVAELQDVSIDTSIYARRKELMCTMLREAGVEFLEPKGAFYVFPKTPIADDVEFTAMLQEERILAVPGVGFGCPGHIRMAFCIPDAVITNAVEGFKRTVERAKAM